MIRTAFALLLAAVSCPTFADRITELNRTERCVYVAKLSVAGYFYYLRGTPRQEVKIHWHGDETQNEIDFVTRTIDVAYARAERLKRDRPGDAVSEQHFGDEAYTGCMAGGEL
jgi:hypothetical protein